MRATTSRLKIFSSDSPAQFTICGQVWSPFYTYLSAAAQLWTAEWKHHFQFPPVSRLNSWSEVQISSSERLSTQFIYLVQFVDNNLLQQIVPIALYPPRQEQISFLRWAKFQAILLGPPAAPTAMNTGFFQKLPQRDKSQLMDTFGRGFLQL